jgi:type I restriction enzyme S subunit
LLQNLFPQEGETLPKVRFPEFAGDGEWKIKTLDELGELVNGLTYSPKDVRNEGLLVLRSSNIQNGIIDYNDSVFVRTDIKGASLSQPKDILVCVRNGSKRLIGKNAIIPENIPLATHGAFMTVFRASNPDFVFQLFQSDVYDRQVKADLGATINSINGKNFIRYEFPVPSNPKEQQKIASCLSAVDALITAQQEKIEQLQQHKKGLMQGLFPKIEG